MARVEPIKIFQAPFPVLKAGLLSLGAVPHPMSLLVVCTVYTHILCL